MNYQKEDYQKAVEFAMNYPEQTILEGYDEFSDMYKLTVFDAGWYNIKLTGRFVRSCLKWPGVKQWRKIHG